MPMFQRSVTFTLNRPPPAGSTAVASSNSKPVNESRLLAHARSGPVRRTVPGRAMMRVARTDEGGSRMSETAWTGTPVRPHEGARDNGAEALPWGGRRERLPMRWPFAEAVEGFRAKALANPDYDPAATFVWGQMMAVGLIEALKSG